MRESGILMPVSSLPGPFGIGTLGKSAYDFVDFLARAGQRLSLIHILPFSSFKPSRLTFPAQPRRPFGLFARPAAVCTLTLSF